GTTPISCTGSVCFLGSVFKLTPGGAIVTVRQFSVGAAGGVNPHALIRGTDGNLYGTSDDRCLIPILATPPCTKGAVFRLSGLSLSNDDLVVDFGASGTWILFDGNTSGWAQFHPATARNIVTGDLDGNGIDEVILDFGSAYGIWV